MSTYIQLRGSEKQIAWATSIRLNFFINFDRIAKQIVDSMPAEQQAMMAKGLDIFKQIFLVESQASFWIENRSMKMDSVDAFRNEFRLSCGTNLNLKVWMQQLKEMKANQVAPTPVVEVVKPVVKEMTAEEKRIEDCKWYN